MKFRRTLGLSVAIATTVSLASMTTVTFASGGHDENDQPASTISALAGALGTLEAPRDIAVSMTDDLRFDPGTIVVGEGETIRFLLDNPTAAPHDFLIGDLAEQLEHQDEMSMGMGHDDEMETMDEGGLPHAVTLEPGESAEVIATFSEAGELMVGCHVPGHWEAGMRGDLAVLPSDQLVLPAG